MAELFSVLSSGADVQLIGLDQLVDVQQTMVIAKPSGVIFPVRVPSAGDIAGPTGDLASSMAAAFNQAATHPGVLGMAVTQDIDPAGNLVDVVIVTVASTNGLVTAEKTLPLAIFGSSSIGLGSLGGLGTFGTSGGYNPDMLATTGASGGGSGSGFSFEAFSSQVGSWQSDLDALAGL